MKPLKLNISAFGPYAGEVDLDFNNLDGHRLFLICGPTGAGKSTILDAMCYALYGETSGGARSGTALRSDYAGLDRLTKVSFTFSSGRKTYRAERVPEQKRQSKRKSDDQVTQKMESALYEIGEDGRERLITAKNVSQKAEEILGVGVAQFRQIILIPQGDFRKLLQASSDDRQKIMKKLFHTERYDALEKMLKARVSGLQARMDADKTRMTTLFASCGLSDGDGMEALGARRAAAETEMARCGQVYKKREAEQAEFQKSYDKAQKIAGAWQRLEEAERASRKLAGEADQIAAKEVHADRIAAAARLKDAKENLDHTRQQGEEKADQLGQYKKDIDRLTKAQAAAEKAQQELEKESAAQQKNIELAARLEQLREPAAAFGEVRKAEEQKRIAAGRAKNTAARAEAEAARAELDRKELTRSAELLERAFLSEQAAVLAASLAEGAPCPVCGALHHPQMAHSEAEPPKKEEVEAARARAKKAESRAETARTSLDAARKETAAAEAAHAACKARLEALIKQVPEDCRDSRALEARAARLRQDAAQYEKQRKAAQDALRGAGEALESAKQSKKMTEQVVQALRDQWKKDRDILLQKAQAEGFRTIQEFEPYFKERVEETRLRKEINDYRASVKAEQEKAEAERKAIGGEEKPDMADWDRRRGAIDKSVKDALTQKNSWENQCRQLRRVEKDVQAILQGQKEVVAAYQVAAGLTVIIAGQENKVNLERFVLGALLDDVLRKANLRLKAMSGSRYQLWRQTEAADGRKNTGLDMDVFDSYTGKRRPANTLSGGETFLASLSLALGLADVVQEYAGGIHLDAMFIDEGFGTLDAESLDLALKTLMGLPGSHRLVGIISHVGELEERVPAKLRVTKTDCGSSARFEIQ